MADEEHLAKLREGPEAWNQWREEAHVLPELGEADLGGANLVYAKRRRGEVSTTDVDVVPIATSTGQLYQVSGVPTGGWRARLLRMNCTA